MNPDVLEEQAVSATLVGPGDKTRTSKGRSYDYPNKDISLVICDRYFVKVNKVMVATGQC